ncbi:hypothetical protein VC279_20270 [Xanthomonas sp. WHRI 10064A]|uniref:hypothetical protein n=1 Tax=unclassified Xanthomonas TaxID=2643310 RepID=UPI002B227411|nr:MULTISPECIES: hypothetical protein [unclassified Xanthomonas]MEA9589709.1 hypothetical protein [Xanthomonas sp. WHRI 10064B]MEA9616940.1 hypothetical protein [Xanthomonas sp. WHRI 10064A]
MSDLSLSGLTYSSEMIAVVTAVAPEAILKREYGCASYEWNLSVIAVIKNAPGFNVKPGQKIHVRNNVMYYQDCVLRQGNMTSGASFMANMYTPSAPNAPRSRRFIVFLEPSDCGYQLKAHAGYESITKRSEVERLASKQAIEYKRWIRANPSKSALSPVR